MDQYILSKNSYPNSIPDREGGSLFSLILRYSFLLFSLILTFPSWSFAEIRALRQEISEMVKRSEYRGWDYLVERLRDDGIGEPDLDVVFRSEKMPRFSPVSFSVVPRESTYLYKDVQQQHQIQKAYKFLMRYREILDRATDRYGVNPYIIGAVLYVETRFGEVLGRYLVLERLLRLSSVRHALNLRLNYLRLKQKDKSVSFEDVEKRAIRLEEMFYPEVKAVFFLWEADREKENNHFHPLRLYGSRAGAYGISQFLPTSAIRFGVDGNGDGRLSLFDIEDAIFSVGNYLSQHGWEEEATPEQMKKVLWSYNHSAPYVDAVFEVARGLAVLDGVGNSTSSKKFFHFK